MGKKENIPKMRFEGFTDNWEQRKLLSLCDKFTDGDWIEAKDQSNSGVRLIQTGNIGVAEYLDKPNNKKWVSDATFESLHCEEVFKGDILISRLPEPAGRACIVPNLGTKMITAVDCTIVRVSENTNNEFLLQYLSSQTYFDEVNTCLAGGTRQRISRSNLADFDVPIPIKKSEQEAIGTFFSNLDNLITLHQCKYEKLKDLKKSMLYKLFPKEGESVPEIRFKGFSGEWEKITIFNLLEERNTQLPKDEEYPLKAFVAYEGIVDKGNRYDRSSLVKDEDNKKYKRTELGDFIYSSNNLTTGSIGLNKFGKASISPVYSIFATRCGVDYSFIGVILTKKEFINKMIRTRQGVVYGQWRIHEKDFLDLCIFAPDYKEQKVIGEYFSELDKLIELNREKLEKLKKIKSTLLDKMFV